MPIPSFTDTLNNSDDGGVVIVQRGGQVYFPSSPTTDDKGNGKILTIEDINNELAGEDIQFFPSGDPSGGDHMLDIFVQSQNAQN